MDEIQANLYGKAKPEKRGLWIHTNSGKQFYAFDPSPDMVDINDIANGLSKLCRYAGQCDEFYSVAQHSVIISKFVSPEHALAGLLHDAAEAYLTDIPRPIKHMFNEHAGNLFSNTESAIFAAVAERFEISSEIPEEVHQADYNIVCDEASVLFAEAPEWTKWYHPLGVHIKPVGWRAARTMFLQRFEELVG